MTINEAAAEAIRSVCGVTVHDGAAHLNTMVTYPSGSAVAIRIRQDGDSWIVDDFPGGQWERPEIPHDLWADVASREAASVLAGLELVDGAYVTVRAPLDRLAGAIMNVANASAALCRMVVERWCSDCDGDPCTDDDSDNDPGDCLGCGVCDACAEAQRRQPLHACAAAPRKR